MFILAIILAVILAGGFFTFGSMKIREAPDMVQAAEHLDIEMPKFKGIGALEVAGALGVLIGLINQLEIIGVLAAIGLAIMTIGAVAFHLKAGDGPKDWAPAVVMLVVSVLYVIARSASA